LGFYMMLKSKGMSVKDHPVVGQIVKSRGFLEKIRPIERKLKTHLDNLYRGLKTGQRPATVAEHTEEDTEDEATDSESFPEEQVAKQTSKAKDPKKKRKKSKAEKVMNAQLFVEEAKLRAEEQSFVKSISKGKKKEAAAPKKFDHSLKSLDNFGEFSKGDRGDDGEDYDNLLEDMRAVTKKTRTEASGDADVPLPKPKQPDFQRFSKQPEKKSQKRGREPEPLQVVDNELYDQVAGKVESKKLEKEAKKRRTPVAADAEEGVEKRQVSREILKNEGLKKYRKKEDRNARVKHRNKYTRAIQKRRKQVQEVRESENTYGGEHTGIKARTVKSVSLG